MDNFNRRKPAKRSSIDGFTPAAGRSRNGPVARGRYTSSNERLANSFKASEGFQSRRGPLAQSDRPFGRQPKRSGSAINMNLDESAVPKPKRFGRRQSWPKIAMKTFAAVIVSGVLVGGYLFGKGYLKARQIFKGGSAGAAALQENVDPTKLNGEGDGRVNILLLGKGGAGHTAPDLTDTVVVASIDPVHNEAALLSIPRDLWVKSNGSSSKINAVYANAKNNALSSRSTSEQKQQAESKGISAVEDVVEDAMGIPIHYHIMVDFEGFKKAIDTVGGIDVNVNTPLQETMRIDGRRYVLDVKTGKQHFDGFKALAYARSRMASKRGDFDRAERQRSILIGMKDKVFSLGTFGNPLKISQLISDFGNNMQSNLGTGEVLRMYEIGKSIDGSKISSVGLADPPNDYVKTANIGGQSVVIPKAGSGDFSEIRNFVRNSLKDGFIRDEDATIAVYNGTSIAGLAGRKATDLRSYGYNISVVADAPNQNYPNTVLVDLTKGKKKYTKSYLQKRLGTTAVTKLPDNSINPSDADFVIILGRNEGSNY